MTDRSYHQLCGLAIALDQLGERWSLLIIRELLVGPRRFVDLTAALPGMGTNLLSQRLTSLAESGLIESRPVPDDRRGRMYVLTSAGETIRPVVLELARWGIRNGKHQPMDGATRPEWSILGLQAMAENAVVERPEVYLFVIDDQQVYLSTLNGRTAQVTTVLPEGSEPAAVIRTDARTFLTIGTGGLDPATAIAASNVEIAGDLGAIMRAVKIMGLRAPLEVDDIEPALV